MTGNFEVFLNDTLIHSKRTRGQGKCESQEEVQAIIDKINQIKASS